jgi:signal transduction histidine kinase
MTVAMALIQTFFAPGERVEGPAVRADRDLLSSHEMLQPIIDAMPHSVALLNEHRQVVAANEAMIEQLGDGNVEALLGLRPGEILSCRNAAASPSGCGTHQGCGLCGAIAAIMAAQSGQTTTRECQVAVAGGGAAELRVKASPFSVGERDFVLIALQDIADEKRRAVLERTFFHDILNVAGGIRGIATVLESTESTAELQEYLPLLSFTTEQLIEEIHAQRDLLAAESGRLETSDGRVGSLEVLREVAALYRNHPGGEGVHVVVDPDSGDSDMLVTRALLVRVLGNMLKNALEASRPGQSVRTGCRGDGEHVEFWVWNEAVMPQEIQLQVFNRSFSTKGTGRGIGTYSMKLLTERYLGGEVAFASAEGRGTEFRIRVPVVPPKA